MKILVCEDDFMMVKAIEHELLREGYEVHLAANGQVAQDKIKSEEFDLILTDLLMPFYNGLEVINLVKNQLQKKTPIIVLSKLGNEVTIIEAFKLGANDYITKPFNPNELSLRVNRLLMKK